MVFLTPLNQSPMWRGTTLILCATFYLHVYMQYTCFQMEDTAASTPGAYKAHIFAAACPFPGVCIVLGSTT